MPFQILTLAAATALLRLATAQKAAQMNKDVRPKLTWADCTGGSCKDVTSEVTIDANWRWLHEDGQAKNCYTNNLFSCDTDAACSKCVYDGQSDYTGTYGVSTSGSTLTLDFKRGNNIGSRVYLLKDEKEYVAFKLLGNEFAFDVDVSSLDCGLNAALYTVDMPLDGGTALYGSAGAAYGMGYADSQCPRDLKFIAGKPNREGWTPDQRDPNQNTGIGNRGSCGAEIDIFEGNSISTAFTLHPCLSGGECSGDKDCGGTYSKTNRYGSKCAPDGADFTTFRRGNTDFYGPEKTLNSKKPYTVVTQFPAQGNSLKEVVRFYVQDGKRIDIPKAKTPGLDGTTLTEASYKQQKALFGEKDDVTQYGGWGQISKTLASPTVLVMSFWDDVYANMLWLDGVAYPTDKSPTAPGVARGTCASTSGKLTDTRSTQAGAKVIFSDIKFGPIGSTNSASKASPDTTSRENGTPGGDAAATPTPIGSSSNSNGGSNPSGSGGDAAATPTPSPGPSNTYGGGSSSGGDAAATPTPSSAASSKSCKSDHH